MSDSDSTLDGEEETLVVDSFFNGAAEQMYKLRRQGILCDVVLVSGGRKLFAHRLVLAATIPYFRAMFSMNCAEKDASELTFQLFTYETLQSIISFAYTGRLTVTTSSAPKILMAASYFQVEKLVGACERFICKKLNNYNSSDLLSLAENCNLKRLMQETLDFGLKNFMANIDKSEFLSLTEDQVYTLLGHDKLVVSDELSVLDALKRWVQVCEEERSPFVRKLLCTVRFPLMSRSSLAKAGGDPWVAKYATDLDLVKYGASCGDKMDSRPSLPGFSFNVRTLELAEKSIYLSGGAGTPEICVDLFRLDPTGQRWITQSNWNIFRSRYSLAALPRKLFVFGGMSDRCEAAVDVYDTLECQLSSVAPLLQERTHSAAVPYGECIYVLGGRNAYEPMSSCEVLYADENRWVMSKPLPVRRSSSSAVLLDGRIYVIGGNDGTRDTSSVYSFDVRCGQWMSMARMSHGRRLFGAVACGGKIFAVGGWNKMHCLRSVECYEPRMDAWRSMSSTLVKRGNVALAAIGDAVFACGGHDGSDLLVSVEIFDPVTNCWSFGPGIRNARGTFTGAVVPSFP